MTREEAITILNMVEAHGSLVIQAKDMAIKALEQEPYDDAKYHEEHGEVIVDKAVWEDAKRALEQEPSGDAVSREAVDDILCWYSDGNGMIDARGAVRMVRELPSVNPQEPKTGHWIYKPKTDLSICDKCGSYCPQDKFGRIETDFCPKCGARMVEPTCDTCEYNTATFNPCNACKDKSEYKPQESEDTNG